MRDFTKRVAGLIVFVGSLMLLAPVVSVVKAQYSIIQQYIQGSSGELLKWDSANVLALRNGGTAGTPVPQSFYIYNFCDGAACATGYERVAIKFSANEAFVQTEAAGTGTVRPLRLGTSVASLYISSTFAYPASADTFTLGQGGVEYRELNLKRFIQGSKSKSLTDGAAATPVIRVPVATNGYQAGEVIWNAQSTDATDFRTTAGRIRFAGVNKAAALTCTVNVVGTDLTASSSANTLVCTWTNVVNTTNCDLSVTCTDNTAGSQTMTINVRADMPTTATLTFP